MYDKWNNHCIWLLLNIALYNMYPPKIRKITYKHIMKPFLKAKNVNQSICCFIIHLLTPNKTNLIVGFVERKWRPNIISCINMFPQPSFCSLLFIWLFPGKFKKTIIAFHRMVRLESISYCCFVLYKQNIFNK